MTVDSKIIYPSIEKPWLKWYGDQSVNKQVVNATVWHNVYESNKDYKNDVSLVFQNIKITYQTLFDKTIKVANALLGNGIKKGDKIIVCSTGTPETVYLLLACSKVGVCVEMINLSLGKENIVSALEESSAQFIFCLDRIYTKLQVSLSTIGKKIVVIPVIYSLPPIIQFIVSMTAKEKIDSHSIIRWKDFLLKQELQYKDNDNPDSELVVVYSSGSTGKPKAIMHTNRSYTAISEQYRICEYPFKRNDAFLNQIPFFIASGLSFMLMAPLMQGIKVILEPEYEPKKWVDDIFKYKPEVICATKSFWDVAVYGKLFEGKDMSFINIAVQGGEPNTAQMENDINDILKKCNCKNQLVVGYGMSEVNGTLTTSSFKYHKAGSTGIPLPGVTVSAFKMETGLECSINERGELMAISPYAMKEYSGNAELTKNFKWVDATGQTWYRTGDIGYIDEQGEVFVLGRAADTLSYSNQTIYLFDIEKEILSLSGISACKVVANDENVIFVNIIPVKKDNNEIDEVKSVISKILPNYIECRIKLWEEFPINANGKCDRETLRK